MLLEKSSAGWCTVWLLICIKSNNFYVNYMAWIHLFILLLLLLLLHEGNLWEVPCPLIVFDDNEPRYQEFYWLKYLFLYHYSSQNLINDHFNPTSAYEMYWIVKQKKQKRVSEHWIHSKFNLVTYKLHCKKEWWSYVKLI